MDVVGIKKLCIILRDINPMRDNLGGQDVEVLNVKLAEKFENPPVPLTLQKAGTVVNLEYMLTLHE